MATGVLMPRQGQSVESCIIIDWKVDEGDLVVTGQPLCEVETDKATFEVEATAAGTVLGIFYPADADVEVLKTIAVIGEPGEDISAFRPATAEQESKDSESGVPAPIVEKPSAVQVPTFNVSHSVSAGASPRARHLAGKKGIDISAIAGSGPGGRVIARDILAAPLATPAAASRAIAEGLSMPAVGSGMGGRIVAGDLAAAPPDATASIEYPEDATVIPVKGIRKVVAGRMLASLQNTAQLTLNASADVRSVLDARARCKNAPDEEGVNGITINDIVLYVTIMTLAEFPDLNAHWLGDKIVQFENVHLGFAVDTPRGLMVPVIRNANRMTLSELSCETKRLAGACSEGTIDPDALTGGTFTVTNLGAMGIESFTPVLNAPEVGILGVCSIQPRPVMKGADVEFVPHMGLSLTFDHSAVDGAPAARFLASLRQQIADFDIQTALGS